jgi:hypothetical protein
MLSDELNKNPFSVPEDYFDNLYMKVQERCSVSNKQTTILSRIKFAKNKMRLAYIAGFGVLALVMYSGLFFINNGENKTISGNKKEQTIKVPASVNSFIHNNAKSYAQITNPDFTNNESAKQVRDEDVVNYLAIENISVDDILNVE